MEEFVSSLTEFCVNTFAGMVAAGGILVWLLVIACGLLLAYFVRIHIAYRMAVNRHRDPLGWVLLSFFFSPLLTWIVLLIAGDATDR